MTAVPGSRRSGPRWHLREATAALHAEADRLGGAHDLSTLPGYARFLGVHARALPGLEAALDAAGLAAMLPDWPRRRRAAALQADLTRLGEPVPAPLPVPPIAPGAAALGAAYVLEGSRLGNTMLLRQAQAGPALAECGAFAYLSHQPGPAGWAGFLALLDQELPDPGSWAAAADGARLAFQVFLDALRTGVTPAAPHPQDIPRVAVS
ncbi:biliverdin-producing heme oxygenase [Teichococcus oryzae]|uniref:Biliverdin-producing heme oxygenase n=1 Tax=Teichococcus oryzae TaxID=1608942 RepID=A0A5B2TF81_9PROT|nr:biliverdin-producing heme oxygenase [Pseudoroseomonas oryzae]KAA2213131.1 biliverdin-producing heme oxygenase [Pseudoroseomonas oryzae]